MVPLGATATEVMATSGDFAAAALLKQIIVELPDGRWYKILQRSADEEGIAIATGTRLVEINALLVNAGLVKEVKAKGSASGIISLQLQRNELELFLNDVDGISRVSHKKEPFLCRGTPRFASVADQSKKWRRDTRPSIQLPANIVEQLKMSTEIYNRMKDEQKAREIAIVNAKKKKAAAIAAAEASKRIQYPILSKLVGGSRRVTLEDDKVKALVRGLLSEIALLHKQESKDITYKGVNGLDVALLPIPACSNSKSFVEIDRNTGWINDMTTLACRNGLSKADAIDGIQSRLRIIAPPPSKQPDARASTNVSQYFAVGADRYIRYAVGVPNAFNYSHRNQPYQQYTNIAGRYILRCAKSSSNIIRFL